VILPTHLPDQEDEIDSSCLHLVLQADSRALETCLAVCRRGDAIVFVATGVCLFLQMDMALLMQKDIRCYCLTADVLAHGIEKLIGSLDVQMIDDSEWVELLAAYPHCLSWK